MITTLRKYVMNDLKVDGYLEAMKEANLEPRVISVSGKTELNEVDYNEILKNEHPEVAIVVRDSMAVSFINVARLLHIHIPDDMQVIGFQNTRYAELSRPKLTCVETPIYDIGEKAMDLLTTLMEREEETEQMPDLKQYVDYSVVWRDSTKKEN
jgi:LacI family transcriptional regulator